MLAVLRVRESPQARPPPCIRKTLQAGLQSDTVLSRRGLSAEPLFTACPRQCGLKMDAAGTTLPFTR
jgi:hypothetical protein